jgi:hypothetical protein
MPGCCRASAASAAAARPTTPAAASAWPAADLAADSTSGAGRLPPAAGQLSMLGESDIQSLGMLLCMPTRHIHFFGYRFVENHKWQLLISMLKHQCTDNTQAGRLQDD